MSETSFSLRLPAEMDGELSLCAAQMERSKAQIAREAIAEWLADYADARDALARKNEKTISGGELRKRLGV